MKSIRFARSLGEQLRTRIFSKSSEWRWAGFSYIESHLFDPATVEAEELQHSAKSEMNWEGNFVGQLSAGIQIDGSSSSPRLQSIYSTSSSGSFHLIFGLGYWDVAPFSLS